MAARASLASLITRVRTLIDDNATTKTFTDDEVQAVLDSWRTDVRYLELTPAVTLVAGVLTVADGAATYNMVAGDVISWVVF